MHAHRIFFKIPLSSLLFKLHTLKSTCQWDAHREVCLNVRANLKNIFGCLNWTEKNKQTKNAHETHESPIKTHKKHDSALSRGPGVAPTQPERQSHSHHLRPGHRVLVRVVVVVVVVVRVPVAKTVHVIVWVHLGPFVRHGDLPELGQPGRAGRDGAGAVEMLPLWSAAMLHDLFILGALILKPYFHLKKGVKKEKKKRGT